MAKEIMSFTFSKLCNNSCLHVIKLGNYPSSRLVRQCSSSSKLFNNGWQQTEGSKSRRGGLVKVNALPDWPLMAVLVHHVQQLDAQREIITNKSIWHLSDEAIKNVYLFYIMFTCWGCLFFGSTKVSMSLNLYNC
ncbi:hypothetical protein REPUB_Repub07fG0056800 [Reevesia pubescens]